MSSIPFLPQCHFFNHPSALKYFSCTIIEFCDCLYCLLYPFFHSVIFFDHPLSLSMSFLYHLNRPLIVHTFFILNIVVYTPVTTIAHSSPGGSDLGTGTCNHN